MNYLSSNWSARFKGIGSEVVVYLPINMTSKLELSTLSSLRKVAFNNMVLDVVISYAWATHELPLLCIVSILATCSCSKLTREPVDLQRYVILDVGQNNQVIISLTIFISHLNVLQDGKLSYQQLALAFVFSNLFSLVLYCLSADCNPPPILTRYFHFLFFTYYAHNI